jgi:Arc/MetJ family transcription regulator
MRTNIVIDDSLMQQAMQASGARSKREAVELGLRTLVRLQQQGQIRSYRGQMQSQGDLEAQRLDVGPAPAASRLSPSGLAARRGFLLLATLQLTASAPYRP